MRSLGLTVLACLIATISHAAEQNWEWVTSSSDAHALVFVDMNSIKTRDGHLSAWVKYDFSVTQKTPGYAPKDYLSMVSLEVFECGAERGGTFSSSYFSGQDGNGEVQDSWASGRRATTDYLRPGSIGYEVLDAVCHPARGQHSKSAFKQTPNATHFVPDQPQPQLTNDRHYTNSDGNQVHSPSYTTTGAIPAGASAQCADGTYSFSQHHQGTCSHHGGVSSWIN